MNITRLQVAIVVLFSFTRNVPPQFHVITRRPPFIPICSYLADRLANAGVHRVGSLFGCSLHSHLLSLRAVLNHAMLR